MEEHQGQQAQRLGLVRHEDGQDPGQSDGFGAQPGADQVGAGRGRVPFVEEQVQHGQHRAGALRQEVVGGDPERDAGVTDLVLGPDQPLGHGCLWHQERPGDLRGREAGQGAQGERHPGFERKGGMAAGKHQPQAVVAATAAPAATVARIARIARSAWSPPLAGRRHGRLRPVVRGRTGVGAHRPLAEPAEFGQLGGAHGGPAHPVDRPVAGCGGEPGPGPAGHTLVGPGGEGLSEGVLGTLLGRVPVAGRANQGRHDAAPLVPEGCRHRGPDRLLRGAPATDTDGYLSQMGLTSIDPCAAPGIWAAISIASSRSLQSTRK